ncbi:carotenoid ester lipase precursor [Marasmius fiardii PR-910]|nr:carotenoid ester lipase precursor [Marasmius fiardii PR-910]
MFIISPLVIAIQASVALATSLAASPTVSLDSAIANGVIEGQVAKFLGIPYAQPPTGNQRFRPPQPISPYTGSINATSTKPACPQQKQSVPLPDGLPKEVLDFILDIIEVEDTPDSEDCLNINVLKPVDATPDSKLPVLVWIFGGRFESGKAAGQNGSVIVEQSLEMNQPVIHVSMDYRSNGFGFLASQEVKDVGVGNLGLRDQREALRWVQKYIGAFGGDPKKVTIWGESAGSISVALQMVTNSGNTENLFRAAFMESGATIPVGDISHGQFYYDQIVSETGCSSSADSLACLRGVPYETLKDAINRTPNIFSYQSLHLTWVPRVDGDFLTDSPLRLALQGKVANIPFVAGDVDDEGTLFALPSLNVTTDSGVQEYLQTVLLPDVPSEEINTLMQFYPQDPSQGSPYNTSDRNSITPQYKRLASILGDMVFQGPRRLLIQSLSGKQDIWSFVSKRYKWFPDIGSAHGTDLLNVYRGGDMADYLIRFAATLDPNGNTGDTGTDIQWPKYTATSPNLLTFQDDEEARLVISQDTYRQEPMKVAMSIMLEHPF